MEGIPAQEQARFDDLTRLAAYVCRTPMALITLVDADQQWLTSRLGVDIRSTSRETSFSAHVRKTGALLVVPDTTSDTRFVHHPFVVGEPHVRAYAGAPIVSVEGHVLGTLCVLDTGPRAFTDDQRDMLTALAAQVMTQLTLRRKTTAVTDLAHDQAAARSEPAVQIELRDITSRVAADEALRASEERFRTLFACAPVGVIEALPDGTLLTVNPKICEMLGYRADELVGQPASFISDPLERDIQADQIASTVHGAAGYAVERTYLRKDGSRMPALISVGAVRGADGSPHRLVGMVIDVSAQVEGQTALVAANDQLREAIAAIATRRQFGEAVLETVNVGVLACDADHHVLLRNAAQRRLTNLDDDEDINVDRVTGHLVMLEADGTELPPERSPLRQALAGADLVDLPLRIGRLDGPLRDVLITARQIRDPDGVLLGAVAAFTDVTSERQVQAQIRENAAFHDAVLAASPDVICVCDPRTGSLLWSSRPLPELDRDHLSSQVPERSADIAAAVIHPEDLTHLLAANVDVQELADGEVLLIRYRMRGTDGHYHWYARRATPFTRDDNGAVTRILVVSRDITDTVQVEQNMAEAALHDPLTNLANRTLLTDRLMNALARCGRTGQQLAVLFCDLDGFKAVNDSGGHAAGDAVLVATAQRLQAALRAEDTVARLGGDEFVVVIEPAYARPGGDGVTDVRADALVVIERIGKALGEPVEVHGVSHHVTASIGVTFASAGDVPEDILRAADTAMYRAKELGKNRHVIAEHITRSGAGGAAVLESGSPHG